MKIYVASSWRCERQPTVVQALREAGHQVYDFRHPSVDDNGFSWREIDPEWQTWSPQKFREALESPAAERGFANDFDAMRRADACVMVQPCGRSAALEAGWFAGAGKLLIILLSEGSEPELMLKLADHVCLDIDEVLGKLAPAPVKRRETQVLQQVQGSFHCSGCGHVIAHGERVVEVATRPPSTTVYAHEGCAGVIKERIEKEHRRGGRP